MELNIKNESLHMCTAVCCTKNNFTAECDVIVPDTKPDILKVLQLSADMKSVSYETKNGRVTASGTLCFNILYLADDEDKSIHTITSSCEFSNIIRDDTISEFMLTFADVDVDRLSYNIANCRKLTLRADLIMSIQVYSCHDLDIISDIDGACAQKRSISSGVICAHNQSTTNLSDSFTLSPGKAPICEIYKTEASITDSDIKLIDDKAIIKGNLRITVLYRSEIGIEHAQSEIPFAHILPADGIREGMDTDYLVKVLCITSESAENQSGDMNIINFSADLYFRVIARCTYTATCITDAFLPHGNLSCKHSPVCVSHTEKTLCHNADLKEIITLADDCPAINEICHISFRPMVKEVFSEGNYLRINGCTEVCILYISGDNFFPVCSYKTEVTFSTACESAGCDLTPVADCILKNMSYTITSDNSVELRGTLQLKIQCIRTSEENIVFSAEECEYTPKKRPGIIVSCVSPGRSLWDIAKDYAITPESILSANALTCEDDIKAHMTLIIPK